MYYYPRCGSALEFFVFYKQLLHTGNTDNTREYFTKPISVLSLSLNASPSRPVKEDISSEEVCTEANIRVNSSVL